MTDKIKELTEYLRRLADKGRIMIPEIMQDDFNTALNQIDIASDNIKVGEWIEIKSEDDLPKNNIECWVMRKKDNEAYQYRTRLYGSDHYDEVSYILNSFSHYQPITKPTPPKQ